MAAIGALTEDFESGTTGTAVTTGTSIFDSISGTSPTFVGSAYQGSLAMQATANAATSIARADYTAATTLWVSFMLKIVVLPGSPVAIANWFNGTTKVGDLRVASDGTLGLRDGNTNVWTSTALASNVWHRISIKVVPNTATGHRVRIYSGANVTSTTSSQDSGDLTATAVTTVSTTDNVRFGIISNETATFVFDRLRADDASEPAPPAGGMLVVDAGADQAKVEPYSTVTLAAVASGGTSPYSYTWVQTVGSPAVTLSGSGASRSFVAPALLNGTTLTFQVTATDTTTQTATDTVTITVLVHNEFTRVSGSWIPYQDRTRTDTASWDS